MTVHKKLASSPLPRLDDVARDFFENLLGQKMSDEPIRVVKELITTK